MKKIFNYTANETLVEKASATTVDAKFIRDLQEVFRKFPQKTTMRFSQDAQGRLIMRLEPTFHNSFNVKQVKEGFCDVDLIPVIFKAAGGQVKSLTEYAKTDHEIEVAAEGENLKLELCKQFLYSGKRGSIEPDWINSEGRTYRRLYFYPAHNLEVHFCLEAF